MDDNRAIGWIAPNGEFHACKREEHQETAMLLLGAEASKCIFTNPERLLDKKGYAKVWLATDGKRHCLRGDWRNMTEEQMERVRVLEMEHDVHIRCADDEARKVLAFVRSGGNLVAPVNRKEAGRASTS